MTFTHPGHARESTPGNTRHVLDDQLRLQRRTKHVQSSSVQKVQTAGSAKMAKCFKRRSDRNSHFTRVSDWFQLIGNKHVSDRMGSRRPIIIE